MSSARSQKPVTRRELRQAHRGYRFNAYRCTGKNCSFQLLWVMSGVEVLSACPRPGCRGRLVRSYAVGADKVADLLAESVHLGQSAPKSLFAPPKTGVSEQSQPSPESLYGITPGPSEAGPEAPND